MHDFLETGKNKTIKSHTMTLNDFPIDARYHRVCQTSRANQNDLNI